MGIFQCFLMFYGPKNQLMKKKLADLLLTKAIIGCSSDADPLNCD